MSTPTRYVRVLVEGYHDRAFFSGWLLHRGWSDPGRRGDGTRKRVVNPVTGEHVAGGKYGFISPDAGTFAEIVPVGADNKVLGALPGVVRRERPNDPHEVVAVLDVDGVGDDAIQQRVQAFDGALARGATSRSRERDVWTLETGLVARLILWRAGDASLSGVPETETLERLVCAALALAYPDRARAVATWLSNRPMPPVPASAKEHAWSYMAGWYAEQGCEQFLTGIWRDTAVATELEKRLDSAGATDVIKAIE